MKTETRYAVGSQQDRTIAVYETEAEARVRYSIEADRPTEGLYIVKVTTYYDEDGEVDSEDEVVIEGVAPNL